jgi:hypothetical protein
MSFHWFAPLKHWHFLLHPIHQPASLTHAAVLPPLLHLARTTAPHPSALLHLMPDVHVTAATLFEPCDALDQCRPTHLPHLSWNKPGSDDEQLLTRMKLYPHQQLLRL